MRAEVSYLAASPVAPVFGRRRRQSPWPAGLLAGCLVLCCATARAQVSLEMTADRTRIGMDQAVTVRIAVEVSGQGSPEIELPSFDGFEIVQKSVSRPMQFSFSFGSGSRQVFRSSTQYTFVLRPYGGGEFVIPPVRVTAGNRRYQTQPLTIVVSPTAAAPPPGSNQAAPEPASLPMTAPGGPAPVDGAAFDNQAFLRTVVDKAEAYVGEQVTVTVYLYLRSRLGASPQVETEPGTDGFWVHDLLPANYRLEGQRQLVSGLLFQAYMLRRFAAFPLRKGELGIGPMTVSIEQRSLFDIFDMMDRGMPTSLRRTGIPVTVLAKELPPGGPGAEAAAVGRFELTAKLDRDQVPTGDAVTLTVTVRGHGNIRGVRPAVPEIDGLRLLQPEIRDLVEAPDDLVGGTRVVEWLVIPTRPGRFSIGPISLQEFDPASRVYRSVQSEPLVLTAVGKAQEAARTGTSHDQETSPDRAAAEEQEHRFGPVRTGSELARRRTRIAGSSWLPWLLALGPVAWLFVLSASALRRQLAENEARSAPRRAVREAKKRLDGAAALIDRGDAEGLYAEINSAIKDLLEARLGEAIGGYTLSELRSHLLGRGMEEELARRTVEELEACDLARFSSSGSSPQEMKRCVERNQELFRRLSGFEPRTRERVS